VRGSLSSHANISLLSNSHVQSVVYTQACKRMELISVYNQEPDSRQLGASLLTAFEPGEPFNLFGSPQSACTLLELSWPRQEKLVLKGCRHLPPRVNWSPKATSNNPAQTASQSAQAMHRQDHCCHQKTASPPAFNLPNSSTTSYPRTSLSYSIHQHNPIAAQHRSKQWTLLLRCQSRPIVLQP
jgi:hypothetical protein